MGYTDLATSGVISTDRATLNGIKTRQHPIQLQVDAASLPPTWARRGGSPHLNFATLDDANGLWTPNDRISRDVNATIRILLASVSVETAKFCEFEISHQSHDPGVAVSATGTLINSGDITVPGVQWEVFEFDFTLAFAEFAATDHGFGFSLQRTTPTGTDAVGQIAVFGCSIIYQVDR